MTNDLSNWQILTEKYPAIFQIIFNNVDLTKHSNFAEKLNKTLNYKSPIDNSVLLIILLFVAMYSRDRNPMEVMIEIFELMTEKGNCKTKYSNCTCNKCKCLYQLNNNAEFVTFKNQFIEKIENSI